MAAGQQQHLISSVLANSYQFYTSLKKKKEKSLIQKCHQDLKLIYLLVPL